MSYFNEMLEKIKLNYLVSYLLYDTDSDIGKPDTYERIINHTYDEMFDKLEDMYPFASRHDDELYGVIMEFSTKHSEIFLEMGIIIGFQLFKNLDKGNQKLQAKDIYLAMKRWLNEEEEIQKAEIKVQ